MDELQRWVLIIAVAIVAAMLVGIVWLRQSKKPRHLRHQGIGRSSGCEVAAQLAQVSAVSSAARLLMPIA